MDVDQSVAIGMPRGSDNPLQEPKVNRVHCSLASSLWQHDPERKSETTGKESKHCVSSYSYNG
eukprot:8340760-Alexandrium_andersonii.AAC.1